MNTELIHQRLFALWNDIPGLRTKSRKLRHWADVPKSQRPALFQAQKAPTAIVQTRQPTKWLFDIDLYLYVSTAGSASPTEVLNPIFDIIVEKLSDPFPGQPQTLGGMVEYCRIEGSCDTSEGTLGDDEVMIIPIKILTL